MSQTELNDSGLKIAEKDLSAMSPTSNDHGRMFNHDGSSAITLADESQTTKPGFYIWDNDEEKWRASGENAQNVGGYTASELATLAEDEAVTGSWNFEVPPTIAMQAIFHDGNPPEKADLNFDPVEQVELEDHISQANAHHTSLENARKENNLLEGNVELSSAVQLKYDTDKTDSPLHFQREETSQETALTILGTKVGIGGETSPSSALDVRGDLNVSGTVTVGGNEVDGQDHNHDELTNVGSSDHHSRYTDSEAVATVNGERSLTVDITGNAGALDGKHAYDFADASHNHDGAYINGYQSNNLSNVDGGKLAKCWETIEVNSGDFTIVDNNTIEVNEAGVYSVDYTCSFHRAYGPNRAIMHARVLINGTDNFDHTGSLCNIRHSTDGEKNSVSNHSMHTLNAGDTIEVRVNSGSGPDGDDLTEASCAVQKIA